MKIGFTGTRVGMTDAQKATLRELLSSLKGRVEEAHHGDCVGSDETFVKMFGSIDESAMARIVSHPPISSMYRARCYSETVLRPKEYLARNRDIVDESDVLFATPKEMTPQDRGGTWYTIRYAVNAGKPVHIILPNGELVRGI